MTTEEFASLSPGDLILWPQPHSSTRAYLVTEKTILTRSVGLRRVRAWYIQTGESSHIWAESLICQEGKVYKA